MEAAQDTCESSREYHRNNGSYGDYVVCVYRDYAGILLGGTDIYVANPIISKDTLFYMLDKLLMLKGRDLA